MKTKHLRLMQRVYIILFFCFMYLPIAYMIVFSFNQSKGYSLFTGFTFKWYRSLFTNASILHALWVSVEVAILSAIIATVLGTAASLGIASMSRKSRLLVTNITYIPVVNPEIITGVSLMLLYAMANIQLGYLTLLLSHIAFCVPYVVLSVMPKLRQIDPNLAEAAQDLGATPMQGFFKVILPDIMPGVFSGFVMALTMSIDDFVVSFFTTGSGVSNLSITIYTMAKRGISPKINALSTIIFACVFVLLIGLNLRDFRKDGRSQKKLDGVKIPY